MKSRARERPLSGQVQNTQRSFKAMESTSDCFVSGAVAAVLRVSRFAGVAPLRFVKEKSGWRVSVSPALSIYGYIIVTITILITFGTLVSDLSLEQKHSVNIKNNTLRVVQVTNVCLAMLIGGTVVYCAPSRMRSMIRYLNHLQKINHELNIDHWPMCHETTKIIIFTIWVIFTVVLNCIDFATSNNHTSGIQVMYIFCSLLYWIMQLQQMQFIMITMHLLSTFKAFNRNLKNLLRTTSEYNSIPSHAYFKRLNKKCMKTSKKIVVNSRIAACDNISAGEVPKPSQTHHQTMHLLALVHTATCDVLKEVDRSHGQVLLMLLGAFILKLVCTLYFFIYNLLAVEQFQSLLSYFMTLALQILWCIYHVCNLVMFIEPCHWTHAEMEYTQELAVKLMWCTSTFDPLVVELEHFFRHFELNQASYSPLRITTMSRALIATILGSVTTYLAIVMEL